MTTASSQVTAQPRNVALIDLLDRLLQGGVVIHGEIRLAAADIDLVNVDIQLLIAAADRVLAP